MIVRSELSALRCATRREEQPVKREAGQKGRRQQFFHRFSRSLRALPLFHLDRIFCNFFGVYRFTCASKIDDAYVACFARLAVYNRKAVGRVSVAQWRRGPDEVGHGAFYRAHYDSLSRFRSTVPVYRSVSFSISLSLHFSPSLRLPLSLFRGHLYVFAYSSLHAYMTEVKLETRYTRRMEYLYLAYSHVNL